MANLMHERHVVISAFDWHIAIGGGTDPYIPSIWRAGGKVCPGRSVIIHVGVAAKTQITHIVWSFRHQGELNIGYCRPFTQRFSYSDLLLGGQGIAGRVLVVTGIVAGEH